MLSRYQRQLVKEAIDAWIDGLPERNADFWAIQRPDEAAVLDLVKRIKDALDGWT